MLELQETLPTLLQLRLAAQTWAIVQGRYLLCRISAHLLWGHQVAARATAHPFHPPLSWTLCRCLPRPLYGQGCLQRCNILSCARPHLPLGSQRMLARMLAVLTPKMVVDAQLQQQGHCLAHFWTWAAPR